MNPQHKQNKLNARARRIARKTYHTDLGNKLEPAEATYHATSAHSAHALPKGNILLVANIISNDSTNATHVLRAITETTLAVA